MQVAQTGVDSKTAFLHVFVPPLKTRLELETKTQNQRPPNRLFIEVSSEREWVPDIHNSARATSAPIIHLMNTISIIFLLRFMPQAKNI